MGSDQTGLDRSSDHAGAVFRVRNRPRAVGTDWPASFS